MNSVSPFISLPLQKLHLSGSISITPYSVIDPFIFFGTINRNNSYMIFALCQHDMIWSPAHTSQKQSGWTRFVISILFDHLATKYNLPDIFGGYISLKHSDPCIVLLFADIRSYGFSNLFRNKSIYHILNRLARIHIPRRTRAPTHRRKHHHKSRSHQQQSGHAASTQAPAAGTASTSVPAMSIVRRTARNLLMKICLIITIISGMLLATTTRPHKYLPPCNPARENSYFYSLSAP
jgi:hypothetical protein